MAADSQTNVYDRPVFGIRKIARLLVGHCEALLGLAGDGALLALVERAVTDTTKPDAEPDPQRWAAGVAQLVTEISVEAGLAEDGRMDGLLLLGGMGRLWTITHMQAIAHLDGVAALGSGEGPAIGALDALLAYGMKPERAVTKAVQIAIERDQHCGGDLLAERLAAPYVATAQACARCVVPAC